MPIRFRCAYCNQLLGIARRKAGTVVRCPNCSGQVVVPTLEEAGLADAGSGPPSAPGGQLLEGNEIDRMLEGAEGDQPSALDIPPPPPTMPAGGAGPGGAPAAVAPLPPAAAPAPPAPAPPAPIPVVPPNGIWLSPGKATLLSVLAVLGLAVAFGLGLLVGIFLQSNP